VSVASGPLLALLPALDGRILFVVFIFVAVFVFVESGISWRMLVSFREDWISDANVVTLNGTAGSRWFGLVRN
jgi:hypothetical protein